jgi:hypothetical protein
MPGGVPQTILSWDGRGATSGTLFAGRGAVRPYRRLR